MLDTIVRSFAFWGFLGALMYAGPRVVAGVFSNRARGLSIAEPIAEGVVAIMAGTIAGAAFTEWALAVLADKAPADSRGVSVMLGLLANRTAPRLVDAIAGRLLGRVKGSAE